MLKLRRSVASECAVYTRPVRSAAANQHQMLSLVVHVHVAARKLTILAVAAGVEWSQRLTELDFGDWSGAW